MATAITPLRKRLANNRAEAEPIHERDMKAAEDSKAVNGPAQRRTSGSIFSGLVSTRHEKRWL